MLERAELTLEPTDDPDALILAADIAEARGKRSDALEKTTAAIARNIEVLGGAERMARWRRATLGPGPRMAIAIAVDGVPWRVSFQTRAILGRVDADVVVPAPTVSRRQIEFFLRDGIPHLADAKSKHGTVLDGAPLRLAIPVESPVELRLCGTIPCSVRPAKNGQLVVETAGGMHLLALGAAAWLDAWKLERTGRHLSVSKWDARIRRVGEREWRDVYEAQPDDLFEAADGSRLSIHRESFEA